MESRVVANNKLAQKEMDAGKLKVKSKPGSVEIGSTTICNIIPPCVMCGKHLDDDPQGRYTGHLSKELIKVIARDIDRSENISLHGIGEPLTNPALFDVVKYADPEAKIIFNSNGLLMNEAKIDAIIQAKIKQISFSLDAATPEVYRKIRGQDFGKVVGNIRRLKEKRDALGLLYPRIIINMVLMRENLGEIPKFFELAKDLGAGVYLCHMNEGLDFKVESHGWTFQYETQQCYHDPELHDRMVEEAFRLAKEYDLLFSFIGKRRLSEVSPEKPLHPPAGEEVKKEFFCPRPWKTMLIGTEGAVRICCHQKDAVGYLRPRIKLGIGGIIKVLPYQLARKLFYMITGRSFWAVSSIGIMDIWNSTTMRDIRQQMLNHELPEICKSSNRCIYRDRF